VIRLPLPTDPVASLMVLVVVKLQLTRLLSQRSMLAQLSARLVASRTAGLQHSNNGLGVQVQGGEGPEDGPVRLVLGDDCRVM
jgi:hypothetical protein